MTIRRAALHAAVLAVAALSAAGCACATCPAGTRRGASIGWAVDRFSTMTFDDSRVTSDRLGGLPCAFQAEARRSSQALCDVANLYNGCHGHGGE